MADRILVAEIGRHATSERMLIQVDGREEKLKGDCLSREGIEEALEDGRQYNTEGLDTAFIPSRRGRAVQTAEYVKKGIKQRHPDAVIPILEPRAELDSIGYKLPQKAQVNPELNSYHAMIRYLAEHPEELATIMNAPAGIAKVILEQLQSLPSQGSTETELHLRRLFSHGPVTGVFPLALGNKDLVEAVKEEGDYFGKSEGGNDPTGMIPNSMNIEQSESGLLKVTYFFRGITPGFDINPDTLTQLARSYDPSKVCTEDRSITGQIAKIRAKR